MGQQDVLATHRNVLEISERETDAGRGRGLTGPDIKNIEQTLVDVALVG